MPKTFFKKFGRFREKRLHLRSEFKKTLKEEYYGLWHTINLPSSGFVRTKNAGH